MELSCQSATSWLGRGSNAASKSNHIMSVIREMSNQETTVYKTSHYLEGTVVTAHDRTKLCVWGYSMADACKVDRNIATVAISYFDRFLSYRGLRYVEVCLDHQREFQLAFIVSIRRTQQISAPASSLCLTRRDISLTIAHCLYPANRSSPLHRHASPSLLRHESPSKSIQLSSQIGL